MFGSPLTTPSPYELTAKTVAPGPLPSGHSVRTLASPVVPHGIFPNGNRYKFDEAIAIETMSLSVPGLPGAYSVHLCPPEGLLASGSLVFSCISSYPLCQLVEEHLFLWFIPGSQDTRKGSGKIGEALAMAWGAHPSLRNEPGYRS